MTRSQRLLAGLGASLLWLSASFGFGFTIPWGDAPEQLGLSSLPEQETVGPLTFALSPWGTILVADTVHEQIKEFSTQGSYLRTFASYVRPTSMSFDSNRRLLTLQDSQVRVFDAKGQQLRTLTLPPALELAEGYAQEVFWEEGKIAVNDPEQQVYLFDEKNPQPTTATAVRRGRADSSGKRHLTQAAGRQRALVGSPDSAATPEAIHPGQGRQLGAVVPRLAADAHPLVEVEELSPSSVHLYLRDLLSTGSVELPNDYFTTVYKKFEVLADQSLWQMRTTAQGVEFSRIQMPAAAQGAAQ